MEEKKNTTNIDRVDFDVCCIDPEKPYIWDTEKVRQLCKETADNDHKYIIFYYGLYEQYEELIITKWDLKSALAIGYNFIETTDLSSMHFSLLESGYRIFFAFNSKCIELEPGMRGVAKDIRPAHHISRMACAGFFNYLLGIPD